MAVYTYPPVTTTIAGGATAANQASEIALLTTIDADTSSIDTKIIKSDTDNVTVVASALPTGAASAANQSTANASLAAIDGNVTKCDTDNVVIASGSIDINALSPVDFLDSGVVDASSTAIPAAGLQIVSALAADVKELEIIEDIGEFMAITDGSDNILSYCPLGGGRVKVLITSGTTIKIASLTGSNIIVGKLAINFLG